MLHFHLKYATFPLFFDTVFMSPEALGGKQSLLKS